MAIVIVAKAMATNVCFFTLNYIDLCCTKDSAIRNKFISKANFDYLSHVMISNNYKSPLACQFCESLAICQPFISVNISIFSPQFLLPLFSFMQMTWKIWRNDHIKVLKMLLKHIAAAQIPLDSPMNLACCSFHWKLTKTGFAPP